MCTTLRLDLTAERVLALPADIARQAGLDGARVEVIVGERSLTVIPALAPAAYAARWSAAAARLREQAAPFGPVVADGRDERYWAVVDPLFDEAEQFAPSV